jgi:hypothetical protein
VKAKLEQQIANDLVQHAQDQLIGQGVRKRKSGKQSGGKINFLKGLKTVGNTLIHGVSKVASNPFVQQVGTQLATHAIEGAMMGAGKKKRFVKGSEEARRHMAHLRSLKGKKGGALFAA